MFDEMRYDLKLLREDFEEGPKTAASKSAYIRARRWFLASCALKGLSGMFNVVGGLGVGGFFLSGLVTTYAPEPTVRAIGITAALAAGGVGLASLGIGKGLGWLAEKAENKAWAAGDAIL